MTDKKYCLQLAECSCSSNNDVYSYDEIEIGTWVDGKSIYRKVLVGTTAAAPTTGSVALINVAALNIKKLICLYATMFDNKNIAQITPSVSFPATTSSIPSAMNLWYHDPNKDIMHMFQNAAYGSTEIHVVIEYTKV